MYVKAYDSVLTKPSSGQYSLVLACHKILSRSLAISMMTCGHVCGSTTVCTRGGSLWNGAFDKARVRAPAPPVQRLLRGGYKRGLLIPAFQGGQRHHGRFVWCTLGRKRGRRGGGAGGSNSWRGSPGDVPVGHALC